jgi:hypothetical protein
MARRKLSIECDTKKMDNVSLKEYFDTRLSALKESIESEKKLMEHRLEKDNKIREQLEYQSQTFLPRVEYELKHELLKNDYQSQINPLKTLVYIGLGLCIAFELIFRFLIK